MKTTYFLFFSIFSLIVISCQNENVQLSSVSGTITVYDEDNPDMIIPLEEIKVYLVDAGIDTFSMGNSNTNAFIDSVYTNENGEYGFENLRPNAYAVFPDKTDDNYVFETTNGKFSDLMFNATEEGNDFIVDFTTPMAPLDCSGGMFTLTFVPKETFEIKMDGSGQYDNNGDEVGIVIKRYEYPNPWTTNIKETSYFSTEYFYNDMNKFSLDFEYGYEYFLWSLSNTFTIDVYYDKELKATFEKVIDLPITGCPAESTWQIDWKNNYTITRLD